MERACRLEALRWLCDIDDDTDFGSSGRKSSLKWITLEEVIEDDESFPSHDVVDIKSPPSSSL